MSQFYYCFVSIILTRLQSSITEMKIYTIPVFVLMVGVLGYCVHQQAETKKHQEFQQILKQAQPPSNLLESNRHRH